VAKQLNALKVVKDISSLKKEIDSKTKALGLLGQYGFSLKKTINPLDSKSPKRSTALGHYDRNAQASKVPILQ
jgi:hypothetical protein